MDWNAAIEKHREALVHILASLVAMTGLGDRQSAIVSRQSGSAQAPDGSADCLLPTADCRLTLPRRLRLAVLRLLRPAESAARRLIIAAARGLVVTLPSRKANPRQAHKTKIIPAIPRSGIPTPPAPDGSLSACPKPLSLPLFDPLQHPFRPRRPKQNGVPRICFPGFTEPFPIASRRPPAPDDAVDAGRLCRRLEALASALDDLPRQALRFARWRMRRDAAAKDIATPDVPKKKSDAGRIRRIWPLRMGRSPGSRRRPSHEVHEVLAATHGLARWALERPDTS
jgi:hypothetical protein